MKRKLPSLGFFPVILLLAFVWGSSFILMKLGLFDSTGATLFKPWEVAALRITIAGFVLLPFSLTRIKRISSSDWVWLGLVGLIGNTIPAFLFTAAEVHLASSIAGMLNSLTPLFTLAVAALIFGTKYKLIQLIGLLIGFAGALGMMGLKDSSGDVHIFSTCLIVLATMLYAFSVNIIRNKLAHLQSITIASVSLGLMSIPCFLSLLFSDVVDVLSTKDEGWMGFGAIFLLAAVGTAGALILFNKIIQKTSALFASSVTYVIPVFAAFWGWIYGEHLEWMHGVFALVILFGVYLVNAGKRNVG